MRNKKQKIFEIMAIILISLFCISITPKTLQNDTFYTIKIGEHIIENRKIDMMDQFSWHEGLEYTYPHWLYDVVTYIIYNYSGMLGIYISTCILATILGIAIYKINSQLNKNKVLSFFIAVGTMYMLRNFIAARAQLVTFILFILEIFFIEKLINTKQKRYGIGLILISILIVNLHIAVWPFSFILYLPYIAEHIIAILEEKHAKKYDKKLEEGYKIIIEKKNGIKSLIIVMLICVLTGLLTPLGPTTPYTYLIKTIQGNTTQYIGEHLPMVLIENIDILCVIMIFLTILIFVDSKIRLSDLFMLGGLFFLMIYSTRQVSMFILIGSVILNRIIFIWMDKRIDNIDEKMIMAFTSKIGVILLVVFILVLSIQFIQPKIDKAYIDEEKYPVEMSEFILKYFEENNIDTNNVRLYNEYNFGSYLIYKGIPVFIDSRADLYTPEFNHGKDIFTDYCESFNLNIWFEDIFEKYDITHVILYKNSKINTIITEGEFEEYELLKEDDNFVFYKRGI